MGHLNERFSGVEWSGVAAPRQQGQQANNNLLWFFTSSSSLLLFIFQAKKNTESYFSCKDIKYPQASFFSFYSSYFMLEET